MPRKPEYRPWHPEKYEPADVRAIKNLAMGEADEIEQARAFKWIVENLCRTYDQTYFPESDRDSAFAEGKRFVGNALVKMLRLNPAALAKPNQPREQG